MGASISQPVSSRQWLWLIALHHGDRRPKLGAELVSRDNHRPGDWRRIALHMETRKVQILFPRETICRSAESPTHLWAQRWVVLAGAASSRMLRAKCFSAVRLRTRMVDDGTEPVAD